MQITTVGNYSVTLGWIIAFLVLIVVIVLLVLSMIEVRLGLLIGGVALARLL
jgi:hypothetical protein